MKSNRRTASEVKSMKRKLVFPVVATLALLATAVVAVAAGSHPSMGPMSHIRQAAMHGFYDGHKDTFLSTDVSSKAEARQEHINFSSDLGKVPMARTDDIYLFQGPAAAGQLPVFGSEPGESDYTPLWHEDIITWEAGVTPTVLKSDTAIESAVKQGRVTELESHVILNCPIVKVG
jgi:hypothetical protein